ncbi:MAG: nicotinate phosphoribosyltransferase [Methanomicrobiales archaeon]|nr:nicotinate phosphoribosyltransferase [Methanomicrobiales archaeon]
MRSFHIVPDERILDGSCTDVYFQRIEDVLRHEDLNPLVSMEVSAASLPAPRAVFCGLDDVLTLFEGVAVDLFALPEGSVFYAGEPVVRVTGRYTDFGRLETAMLGFLCHASGIATAAADIKALAGDLPVYSFGSRRQHPALATMIERAAWIGGVDGVSNTCAPAGLPLIGTMPHAFVMCHETPEEAWQAFAAHAPSDVPRVMLCDTFCDEKREALRAAELGCAAVRLDTPRSRRGDMRAILEEVRWELDAAGYEGVRIFLTGGVSPEDVISYRDIVDAFGVGGAIANAPVIDFSFDIVEKEGRITSKRGKRSGPKQIYELPGGGRKVLPAGQAPPAGATPLLRQYIKGGTVLAHEEPEAARKRVQEALRALQNRETA